MFKFQINTVLLSFLLIKNILKITVHTKILSSNTDVYNTDNHNNDFSIFAFLVIHPSIPHFIVCQAKI